MSYLFDKAFASQGDDTLLVRSEASVKQLHDDISWPSGTPYTFVDTINNEAGHTSIQVIISVVASSADEIVGLHDLVLTGVEWETNCSNTCCNNGFFKENQVCKRCPAGTVSDSTPDAVGCTPCAPALNAFAGAPGQQITAEKEKGEEKEEEEKEEEEEEK